MAHNKHTKLCVAGDYGMLIIGDTVQWDGIADAIQVLTATVFTTLTGPALQGIAVGSIVFPTGAIIYGRLTTVKLASGSVALYFGRSMPGT